MIAVNRPVDGAFAEQLGKQFIEVLLAPGYDAAALEALQVKKNVRLLELGDWPAASREVESKPVIGGQLVQTHDVVSETREQMRAMSARQPSEQEWRDMLFAWVVCRHVRSNAIVLAAGGATIGIGAGQMSRVDAVRIAIEKARAFRPDQLAGCGARLRRLLPLRRRPAARARRRRQRDHPAGRLGARRGGRRGGRRGRRGDGRHRRAPLPALSFPRRWRMRRLAGCMGLGRRVDQTILFLHGGFDHPAGG